MHVPCCGSNHFKVHGINVLLHTGQVAQDPCRRCGRHSRHRRQEGVHMQLPAAGRCSMVAFLTGLCLQFKRGDKVFAFEKSFAPSRSDGAW